MPDDDEPDDDQIEPAEQSDQDEPTEQAEFAATQAG
jgi:hypothetical protein